MNIGRMLELGAQLLDLENKFRIQKRLTNVAAKIQDIVNAPQDVANQTNALSAVMELKQNLENMAIELDQASLEFLTETGGAPYFLPSMGTGIEAQIRSSGITPAVAKQYIDDLVSERNRYIENLKAASTSLKALKFSKYEIPEGQAEIGFKIPRALFNNNVGELADELSFIDFTIFTFAEAVTGEKQEGQLAQLSTTDPVVLLTTAVPVVAAMAATIKWLLDAYAKYLEILKLRTDLRKVGMPESSMQELDGIADQKLQEAIEAAVERILKKQRTGRAAEVANGLRIAMNGLLARIERGMTVEVRFLPPPRLEGESEEATQRTKEQEEEFRRLQKDLVFPPTPAEPLLSIPSWPKRPNKNEGNKSSKRRGRRSGNGAAIQKKAPEHRPHEDSAQETPSD